MMATLRLVPYESHWPATFEAELVQIQRALAHRAQAIEHVGSTAVPGLAGKPVLDIAIAVADFETAHECIPLLEEIGYHFRGANGDDPRRHYYVRNTDGQRVAQIHLYVLPAIAWNEHLAFRDALRASDVLAKAYAAEKWRVANSVNWDKAAYSVAKGQFVQDVLQGLPALGHSRRTDNAD